MLDSHPHWRVFLDILGVILRNEVRSVWSGIVASVEPLDPESVTIAVWLDIDLMVLLPYKKTVFSV